MKKNKLYTLIVLLIIVAVTIVFFSSLSNNIKYHKHKNDTLNYLKNKYSGFKFSVESIEKNSYDNTFIYEIIAQTERQKPFGFQVRELEGGFIDYFLNEQLGQDERNSLYEVLGSQIGKIEIKDISVTRNSFANYGITGKNYNDKTMIEKIPIEVTVEFKGSNKIEVESFVDLSVKVRNAILIQKHFNVNEIWVHYNFSDKYMGLYLQMTKEDFCGNTKQLLEKVIGHFNKRG